MVHTMNNLLLLQLLCAVELQQLSLHVLIFQQFHAILLVEVYQLNLLILLLDITIMILIN